MTTDKELLEIYMLGFNDELDGKVTVIHGQLKQRAYRHGRTDAIVGDDVSSSDEQSDQAIINKIRKISG